MLLGCVALQPRHRRRGQRKVSIANIAQQPERPRRNQSRQLNCIKSSILTSIMFRVARKISGNGASCICGISQSLPVTMRVRAPPVAFAVIAFALHVLVLLMAVHGASGAGCAAVTAGGPRNFKILLQINAWNKVSAALRGFTENKNDFQHGITAVAFLDLTINIALTCNFHRRRQRGSRPTMPRCSRSSRPTPPMRSGTATGC